MARVSVIIPTYNRARFIKRAVNSALWQSFQDFEIIVVDDGSTDNTIELLGQYRDHRLRILRHETNRGASAALNTGITNSSGSLISILDSDDEWLPEKLERQVEVMDACDAMVGIVYCDMWKYRGDQCEYYHAPHFTAADGIIYDKALDGGLHNIGNPLVLIRRECFDKVGLFDESLRRHIDLDMAIRISKYFYLHHMAEPLTNYHVTAGSITAGGEAAAISSVERMVEKQFDDLLKSRAVLAKRMYWIGSAYMRAGRTIEGKSYLRETVKYS